MRVGVALRGGREGAFEVGGTMRVGVALRAGGGRDAAFEVGATMRVGVAERGPLDGGACRVGVRERGGGAVDGEVRLASDVASSSGGVKLGVRGGGRVRWIVKSASVRPSEK